MIDDNWQRYYGNFDFKEDLEYKHNFNYNRFLT